jgi:lipopolysaccharide export system permease protein
MLSRYITARLAFGWLLVFLTMTALFSFLELVSQLDDIGKGSYQTIDAFLYVAYTLPGRVLGLAAVSSLLGAIVGLGTLANTDELLAMRSCGISVFRVARVLLSAGSVIIIGVLLLTQFVVPPLEQKAKINRELALSEEGSLLSSGGFWTRDSNNRFINVRSSAAGVGLADVSIYEFDDQGKPISYVGAAKTEIGKDGQWVGHDARQINFSDKLITDQVEPSLALDVFLNTRQINILSITPAMLSLDELYQYIQVLRERGQNTEQFVLALWQKTTLPLKVGAMLFFSLPFVFGTAREVNPGRRVTLGAIAGISYYYFDQALGYMGLLLGVHPAFTTLLPLAIIILIATWLLFRVP